MIEIRERSGRLTLIGVSLLFGVASLLRFTWPDRGYLASFADDFYYYLVVAENLATTGVPTFNGISETNGFHPLWMLVQVCLLSIIGESNKVFFVSVSMIIAVLTVLTFALYRSLAQRITPEPVLALSLALYCALFAFALSTTGMEIGLTMFLMALLTRRLISESLREQTRLQLLLSGFIASLLVLSRLDSAIFVALLLVLETAYSSNPKAFLIRKIPYFALGGILVPGYIAFSILYFGTFMPISGEAKQLKDTLWPNMGAFFGLFSWKSLGNIAFVNVAFAAMTIAILLLLQARYRKRFRDPAVLAVIAYPFLLYGYYVVKSDWGILSWYLYPLPIALLLSASMVAEALRIARPALVTKAAPFVLIFMVAFASLYIFLRHHYRPPEAISVYATGLALESFSRNRPGVYAMGDRAGLPGYLMESPIVHLEGLMEDQRMLDNIRRRRNLLQVLREYQVRYYVATNPSEQGSCYSVYEPRVAGEHAPKMQATICEPPVFRHDAGAYRTYVFDMNSLEEPQNGKDGADLVVSRPTLSRAGSP